MQNPKILLSAVFAMFLSTHLVLAGPGSLWLCLGYDDSAVETGTHGCVDERTGDCCSVPPQVPSGELDTGTGCGLCFDLRIDVGAIDAVVEGARSPGTLPVFTTGNSLLRLHTKKIEAFNRALSGPRTPLWAPSPLDRYLDTVLLRI